MQQDNHIEQRKRDHIEINLNGDVRPRWTTTGFEHYRFAHAALPELDLADVDVSTAVFGHHVRAPLLISSMTGGVPRGSEINRRLAAAAQETGCALGVGSQRAGIEDDRRSEFYRVRDIAPDILLFANLGAVQLNYGLGVDECRRAVEMIGADGLILHLNPLQEALQEGGDCDFQGLLGKIASVCHALDVPVIVKEIGFGISARVARRLRDAGVAGIDVSGAGGTSWSAVERYRASSARLRRVAETFIDWGIPTATSLRMARSAAPTTTIIGSGGVETGVDVAKAIAFGADLAGIAGPLFRAAAVSVAEVSTLLSAIIDELRIAMFCTGARTIADLRRVTLLEADGGSGRLSGRTNMASDPRARALMANGFGEG
jgi:isopentenyl-diphosphate delta-isomerase